MSMTIISAASKLATGINVFTLARERHAELIETLTAINREILKHKFPMNVSASFHRAFDAPIVINYNQYTDRALGQFMRTQPTTAPLMKRTHELSEKHEIRWYEVTDVVMANRASDRLEISDTPNRPAAVGIVTVAPPRQAEVLALFKRYGEALRTNRTSGFIGIALHRGYHPEHISTYEQWESVEAYRDALRTEPAADLLEQIRQAATATALHLYEVVSVTSFK
jgi:quinol monooxygenase YgiN